MDIQQAIPSCNWSIAVYNLGASESEVHQNEEEKQENCKAQKHLLATKRRNVFVSVTFEYHT